MALKTPVEKRVYIDNLRCFLKWCRDTANWQEAYGGDHGNHARTRQIQPEYRVQHGEASSARKPLLAFRRAFGSGLRHEPVNPATGGRAECIPSNSTRA